MEQLREENHKLLLKLESVRQSHATELDYYREELEIKDKEFKQQLNKAKEETKAREEIKEEKICALNEEVIGIREENDGLVGQVEKLRVQVEFLRHAKTGGPPGGSNYSDYEGLKESQRILKAQLSEKDDLVTSQTENIRGLTEQLSKAKFAISNLSEEIEGKETAVRELQRRVREIEEQRDEDVLGLQNEVMALKDEVKALKGDGGANKSVNQTGNSRGNSLFSEVEERRIKVEGELHRLRALVKRLTEENRELQLDLERGDSHSANISTQLELISKSEMELAREFKKQQSETFQLIDGYRDRFENLRSEYTRKLQQYKSGFGEGTSSEYENLRMERDTLLLVRISMERENSELKRELKYNKHLRVNAEANIKILKAKLDFAKRGATDDNHQEDLQNANNINLDQQECSKNSSSPVPPTNLVPPKYNAKQTAEGECAQQ